MEWNITMLAIHLVMFVLCLLLWRRAPCWLQRLVVAGLMLAATLLALAYVLALGGVERWWHVALLGFVIEHLAVLLYVFRVVWQGGLSHGSAGGHPAVR